jgi:hypothetical protein
MDDDSDAIPLRITWEVLVDVEVTVRGNTATEDPMNQVMGRMHKLLTSAVHTSFDYPGNHPNPPIHVRSITVNHVRTKHEYHPTEDD